MRLSQKLLKTLRKKGIKIKSISIKKRKLHEVKMPMELYSNGSRGLISYPKHQIELDIKNNELTLKIPSMLIIELFREKVLSAEESEIYPIHISGIKIGNYKIKDFKYPNCHSNSRDKIIINFQKQAKKTKNKL